ncbi:hypothetical protein JTE90_017849 [Oedothorax gibbosus]|uniref:Uncharacterized protein n=1 Tax=Oedothorax gibbosus TaxID=931172 RepID=A0AAV6TUM3_9ARAC|nr:hypothetical protein JTE90_017849 [Oedothorax gibbosus]
MVFLSNSLSSPPHADTHRYHVHNLTTGDHNMVKFLNDVSLPKVEDDYPSYAQTNQDYLNNYGSLLSQASHPIPTTIHRNPNFADLDAHQRNHQLLSQQSVPDIRIYRLPSNEMFHNNFNGDSDFSNGGYPLKKHDFFRGGQQNGGFDGGWDSFQTGGGGGFNLGNIGGGGGLGNLAGAAGVLKKGKEAKALFVLMAPLILLAVFGPILATQAMIPWVANGGLTSVTTIAGSGRRRRRQANSSPRHGGGPEMEKRLQLFLEVQDFITRTGSQDLVEEMGEAFLKCQKYNERRNKCLERVACAYTDNVSVMDPDERRIGKMVLRNVMSNPLVPRSLIGKLNKGFLFGKQRPGQCAANFWCDVVDNRKTKL